MRAGRSTRWLVAGALGALVLACQPAVQGPSPGLPSIRRDAGATVDDAAAGDALAGHDVAMDDARAADTGSTDLQAGDGGMRDLITIDAGEPDTGAGDSAAAEASTPDVASIDADCAGCPGPEDTSVRCSDHVSNDGDGYIDCRDHDCRLVWPCNIPETSTEACADGHDNDGDGHRDCDDQNCAVLPVCQTHEDTALTCTDDVDNDRDTFEDCADPGCQALPVCQNHEDDEATCGDLVDNDGDQLFDCRDPGCAGTAVCNVDLARVATWNIETLSAPGSSGYLAALAVVRRLDPDVLCLQEVEDSEAAALAALAADSGLVHTFQGANSTAMSGGLTVACLSRWPIDAAASRSSDDISSDPGANETGRDIVQLRVAMRPGSLYLGVFSVHLKAGFTDLDRFRRQIEALRLAQVVAAYRAAHPADPLVMMGDFNEEHDDSSLGLVWIALPAGLPVSYQLGSDVGFPQTYDPFAALALAGFAFTEPTLEDRTDVDATRFDSSRRIDYILIRGARLLGDELYDDCEDNGADDAPLGNWLPKAGAPPSCGTAQSASDHRPVLADLDVGP